MDDFFNKSYRFELALRIIDSIDRLHSQTKAVELYEKFNIDQLKSIYDMFEFVEKDLYEY